MKHPPEMSEQEFVQQAVWIAAYEILGDTLANDQEEASDTANAIAAKTSSIMFPE